MARQVCIEFPGAFYHVMARGNRLEAIFVLERLDARMLSEDKEDGRGRGSSYLSTLIDYVHLN